MVKSEQIYRKKLYKVNFKAILEKEGKRVLNLILGPSYG
jgi:hypothetical protein